MKKIISTILVVLMLFGTLMSCNVPDENVNTGTGSSAETGTSLISDTGTNSSTDTGSGLVPDNEADDNLKEKYGNRVYFAFEESQKTYYPEIRDYTEVSDCFEIPLDEKGYKKIGAYMKLINTYDELLTYIIPKNLDESIFNTSYVACVKQFYYDYADGKNLVGYYDLSLRENEFYIKLDCYEPCVELRLDEAAPNLQTTYIVISKDSIAYSNKIHQIYVNDKNYIDEDEELKYWWEYSHNFVVHKENKMLPQSAASWVVKKGSNLEKQLGLESNQFFNSEYNVILYLPNEPEYDFIITEKEIKNGNLYLTIEEYTQYTNEYLNKNDVKFYDLLIPNSEMLSDNFDVYILVESVG